jgi:hypothetical protein
LFYRLDSSRASFRELWWDSRKPLTVGLVWITKLMRVKLHGSMNDPNVRELRPFVRDAAAMPAPSLEKLSVPMRELEQMGFKDAAYLFIDDLLHGTRISMAVLRHGDGRSIARVVWREEHVQRPPKENLFIQFISALKDGRFVWSSSAKAGMEVPSNIVVNWQRGMATEALWASHQQQLQAQTKASPQWWLRIRRGCLNFWRGIMLLCAIFI